MWFYLFHLFIYKLVISWWDVTWSLFTTSHRRKSLHWVSRYKKPHTTFNSTKSFQTRQNTPNMQHMRITYCQKHIFSEITSSLLNSEITSLLNSFFFECFVRKYVFADLHCFHISVIINVCLRKRLTGYYVYTFK